MLGSTVRVSSMAGLLDTMLNCLELSFSRAKLEKKEWIINDDDEDDDDDDNDDDDTILTWQLSLGGDDNDNDNDDDNDTILTWQESLGGPPVPRQFANYVSG